MATSLVADLWVCPAHPLNNHVAAFGYIFFSLFPRGTIIPLIISCMRLYLLSLMGHLKLAMRMATWKVYIVFTSAVFTMMQGTEEIGYHHVIRSFPHLYCSGTGTHLGYYLISPRLSPKQHVIDELP
jgi:hypothetical protein